MQKINGSGVMVFIECQNEIYVLLLSSTGRGGVFLSEPGGKLEPNLNPLQNAQKELFEETYASFKAHTLKKNVIVNNKYICYAILLKVQNFDEIKNIMDSNKKILTQQRSLYCFREMFGYDFIKLNVILDEKQKNIIHYKGQKVELHKRTQSAIKEFIKQEIIKDGLINLQQNNYQIQQHHYNKDNDKLQLLDKQFYLDIV